MLCECGCGSEVPIAKKTRSRLGHKKGMPIRFINGHTGRLQPRGSASPLWKGGYIDPRGYKRISHPETRFTLEHRLIAETILRRPLPKQAVIHHPYGKANNKMFIICENQGYHCLLEQRTRALRECGHANWLRCYRCKLYDDPKNVVEHNGHIAHQSCENEYQRKWRKQKKEKNGKKEVEDA